VIINNDFNTMNGNILNIIEETRINTNKKSNIFRIRNYSGSKQINNLFSF
jgi:hypothetical protein